MVDYIPRLVDAALTEELESIGCVLLEGPKWCGKTSTAEQHANSILYMNQPSTRLANLTRAETDPEALLEGETPRLIDEWQIAADQIWDTVRFTVDHRQAFGQFILTGSATPARLDANTHSGTGRIKRMRMRTMSLYESGDSTGAVSLGTLFDKDEETLRVSGESDLDIGRLGALICRGGWPRAVAAASENTAMRQSYNYYDALVNQEYYEAQDRRNTPEWVAAILRSYARHIGTSATLPVILEDCKNHGGMAFTLETLENYLNYLRRMFVLEDVDSWNPNIRSKTAIRTSPTRYFTDPSIGTAALHVSPKTLEKDLKTYGFFFENLAVRDLRIYTESLGGKVYHYRDKNGLECDAVAVLPDGRYALIEVKLGGDTLVEEGAKTLNKLTKLLNTDKMGAPAFRMVLCGVAPFAYKRSDHILVVPIGCLRN